MSETSKRGCSRTARAVMWKRCGAGARSAAGLWGGCAAGTKTMRSRSRASQVSSATSRWPKWMGLNEPPNTPTRGTGRLLADMPVAPDDDRSPRVKLGGRDPHLGAHAELPPVHQAGGGVDQHRRRVHLLGEAPRATEIAGDDRF